MSLVTGLLRPRLFSSKLSKLKAGEKYSGSATKSVSLFTSQHTALSKTMRVFNFVYVLQNKIPVQSPFLGFSPSDPWQWPSDRLLSAHSLRPPITKRSMGTTIGKKHSHNKNIKDCHHFLLFELDLTIYSHVYYCGHNFYLPPTFLVLLLSVWQVQALPTLASRGIEGGEG